MDTRRSLRTPGHTARLMHNRLHMAPTVAPRLAMMMMLSLCAGCLLPPEAELTLADLGYPPEYDIRSVSPPGSRLDVNPLECTSFTVDVGTIWDKDAEDLLLRWVANNSRPNTQQLQPIVRASVNNGLSTSAFVRVDPRSHFFNEYTLATSPDRPTAVGMLSLFITDAPAWQIEQFDNAERKALDLSRIAAEELPEGELSPYSVVEVRWSVVLSDRLEGCPL